MSANFTIRFRLFIGRFEFKMKNEELTDPQYIQIQGLLDRYLRSKISGKDSAAQAEHLDEDSLTAFIEGKTNNQAAKPIVTHLIACSFCRHITAEIIKLDFAFADVETPKPVSASQPSKISEVLNALLPKIFGSGDEAVFAHEEKKEITGEEADQDSEKHPE